MTQPQDGLKTIKANSRTAGGKQIKSDHQKPPDDGTIGHSIDDVDNSPVSNATRNDINSSGSGSNTKSSLDERRNSFAHRNGGSLNGLNSLISRDTLILLPEGGKNSAANSDKYPVTRSSRNSDNENSDTDVSKTINDQSNESNFFFFFSKSEK